MVAMDSCEEKKPKSLAKEQLDWNVVKATHLNDWNLFSMARYWIW